MTWRTLPRLIRRDVHIGLLPGERTVVSQGGGDVPFWSPDGNTLYYWRNDGAGEGRPASDLHPDGDRIIVAQDAGVSATPDGAASEPERFIVVTNWFEELRQRMGN